MRSGDRTSFSCQGKKKKEGCGENKESLWAFKKEKKKYKD